jgi:hypothetical protein
MAPADAAVEPKDVAIMAEAAKTQARLLFLIDVLLF